MEAKDEIKNRLDIAEFIGEYLDLKKAGGSSLRAVCPFHAEKTPSFYVSKEKQIWHCFGCSLGGDVFSFLMQMEGMDFPEALRILAKRTGVEIPRYTSTQSNTKDRLIAANTMAQRFFEKVYEHATGQVARDYITSRAIPEEWRARFGIGYAPKEYEALLTALRKRGFTDREMVDAGLASPSKRGGFIDRFRHRLMIPLYDPHGNVIGFTGRVLDPEDQPKYMNSPETAVYHKGEQLYGLHLAKSAIKMQKSVVIVEGNLDVLASHRAGVENTVGSSGTALTEAQIRLLKRYTNALVFCFDADAAGFAAAQRGIHLATEHGCEVKVLLIPAELGKDPDDVVKKNAQAWQDIVSHPIPIMEYYFVHATKGKDLSRVEEKKIVGNFLLAEIARLQDRIEQEHWLTKLSDLLRMDLAVLRSALPKTPGAVATPQAVAAAPAVLSREEKAGRLILGLLLQFPELLQKAGDLSLAFSPTPDLKRLYEIMALAYHAGMVKDSSLYDHVRMQVAGEEPFVRLLEEIALQGEALATELPQDERAVFLQNHLAVIHRSATKSKRDTLLHEIREAEDRGDRETVHRLMQTLKTLT